MWTVNEPEDVELCVRLGVDAIITNRPEQVLPNWAAEAATHRVQPLLGPTQSCPYRSRRNPNSAYRRNPATSLQGVHRRIRSVFDRYECVTAHALGRFPVQSNGAFTPWRGAKEVSGVALVVAQEVPTSSSMAVPHGPAGVGEARHRMREQLRTSGVSEAVVDDAVLILSELLSNACRHGRPLGDALVGRRRCPRRLARGPSGPADGRGDGRRRSDPAGSGHAFGHRARRPRAEHHHARWPTTGASGTTRRGEVTVWVVVQRRRRPRPPPARTSPTRVAALRLGLRGRVRRPGLRGRGSSDIGLTAEPGGGPGGVRRWPEAGPARRRRPGALSTGSRRRGVRAARLAPSTRRPP